MNLVENLLRSSCIAVLVMLVGACIEPIPPPADPPDVTAYRSWEEINGAPYASELGGFDINVWASAAADAYREIHPEEHGSGVVLPVGTILMREVLDERGAVAKLTLMAKGPPGYDPRIGDWWFGVLDPRGVPLVEDEVPQLGKLTACHGCHLPRATDDFLFGVPAGNL